MRATECYIKIAMFKKICNIIFIGSTNSKNKTKYQYSIKMVRGSVPLMTIKIPCINIVQ